MGLSPSAEVGWKKKNDNIIHPVANKTTADFAYF